MGDPLFTFLINLGGGAAVAVVMYQWLKAEREEKRFYRDQFPSLITALDRSNTLVGKLADNTTLDTKERQELLELVRQMHETVGRLDARANRHDTDRAGSR